MGTASTTGGMLSGAQASPAPPGVTGIPSPGAPGPPGVTGGPASTGDDANLAAVEQVEGSFVTTSTFGQPSTVRMSMSTSTTTRDSTPIIWVTSQTRTLHP